VIKVSFDKYVSVYICFRWTKTFVTIFYRIVQSTGKNIRLETFLLLLSSSAAAALQCKNKATS
jgi:hypothetical protein